MTAMRMAGCVVRGAGCGVVAATDHGTPRSTRRHNETTPQRILSGNRRAVVASYRRTTPEAWPSALSSFHVRGRRNQPAFPIDRLRDARLIERLTIPELARDLLVHLVEALAVVGEAAPPHGVTLTAPHLEEPVGVGERLPGGGDDVRGAGGEDLFRLVERGDATGHDDRGGEPGIADRAPDPPRRFDVAPERTGGVTEDGRHALPSARTCVRIHRPSHLRLLGVLEFAAARQRQEVHAGARELHAEEDGV